MTSKYVERMISDGLDIDNIIPLWAERHKVLVEKLRNQKQMLCVPSGIRALDDLIGGFEGGRLYVLSAPTKNGKTTLAQTLLFNQSLGGIGGLFFSYEMGWQEVTKKYMAMDKFLNKVDSTDLPLYMPIDLHREGGDLQLLWIMETIAKCKEDYPLLGFVVIDHLHFLLPLRDYRNVSFIIGGIVRQLKRLSVIMDIPIMLIAHTGKIRDDTVPSFRDIRDSSFITQEADVVMMMWRLKQKNSTKKVDDESVEDVYTNKAILSVELDRIKGNSGKIKLWHNGVMFEEYNPIIHGILETKIGGVCTNYPTT